MKFKQPIGATSLSDASGLIPKHITTQEELNEWEQRNVLKASREFLTSLRHRKEWLNPKFIKTVHFEMFNETWEWAGHFRKSNMNIGAPWYQIDEEIKKLCDDIKIWPCVTEKEIKESAIRLHHHLTVIHPFPDGNGRHARLMANIFLYYYKYPIFLWGNCPLYKKDLARKEYLKALKEADRGDLFALIKFAESSDEK